MRSFPVHMADTLIMSARFKIQIRHRFSIRICCPHYPLFCQKSYSKACSVYVGGKGEMDIPRGQGLNLQGVDLVLKSQEQT